jgi:hypothetical protein
MASHPQQKYKQIKNPFFLGLLLSVCIIFLQVGFTYYYSFQTLGTLIAFVVITRGRPSIINSASILLFSALFITFLSLTAITVPLALSENSENIFYTYIGVIGYALMIIISPNIAFKSPESILRFFKLAASATLIATACLICITDLAIIPFLTRETLILQNATLVTNYTAPEMLADSFIALERDGLTPHMDLFYGEQSFLSIVIFTCVASYIICDSLLRKLKPQEYKPAPHTKKSKSFSFANYNLQGLVTIIGMASMIYIKSFSSFFYVLVIFASLLLSAQRRSFRLKLTPTTVLAAILAVILLGGITISAYDYYVLRFSTVSDSISFEQRFSSLFDFGLNDYLFGVTDVTKLPKFGFQNGVLYIIGVSGLGGICWMLFLFYRVHIVARHLKLSLLAVMCVFGIFSQSGGIFTPHKILLLWLILIPLSCMNRIKMPQRVIKTRHNTDQTINITNT